MELNVFCRIFFPNIFFHIEKTYDSVILDVWRPQNSYPALLLWNYSMRSHFTRAVSKVSVTGNWSMDFYVVVVGWGEKEDRQKTRSIHAICNRSGEVSWGQIKQVRSCFFKTLGKWELGLFRKSRTEANEAGASKRGKWLETRSGRQQGQDQLLIHSTFEDIVDLGCTVPRHWTSGKSIGLKDAYSHQQGPRGHLSWTSPAAVYISNSFEINAQSL